MDVDLEEVIRIGRERLGRMQSNPEIALEEVQGSLLSILGELEFLEYFAKIKGVHFPEELTQSVDLALDVFRGLVQSCEFHTVTRMKH
jgi:hypothetical protein